MGLALVGWAIGAGAVAGELWVESLLLPHEAGWQRGPASQEEEDDAYALERREAGGPPLLLLLPRRAPRLKSDADTYYRNLTRHWRGSYGKGVLIDWLELGGARWLYLRRPARENGQGLFQLSTVHQGRAYSLLAFVPGDAVTLPAPVQSLLAGLRWVQGGPGLPARTARWARAGTHRLLLAGPGLEAVAQADADALGGDGLLTGFGLDYGVASVNWFMEGYTWVGKTERRPWSLGGKLEVEAPAELDGQTPWTFRLSLQPDQPAVQVSLVERDLCGAPDTLREAMGKLEHGLRGPLERLLAHRSVGCPAPEGGETAGFLAGEPGRTATANWTPPAGGAGPSVGAGLLRVRLMEAVLAYPPGTPGGPERPGEGLLSRARLFFAYELR